MLSLIIRPVVHECFPPVTGFAEISECNSQHLDINCTFLLPRADRQAASAATATNSQTKTVRPRICRQLQVNQDEEGGGAFQTMACEAAIFRSGGQPKASRPGRTGSRADSPVVDYSSIRAMKVLRVHMFMVCMAQLANGNVLLNEHSG